MTASDDRPQLWSDLCQLEAQRWRLVEDISRARRRFIDNTPNRGAVLRAALDRGERWPAILTIEELPEAERRQFLPDLVHLASTDIRDLPRARLIILSLDRAWLLENLPPLIWAELGPEATDEQYRFLAELADKVDASLVLEIARRALAHSDPYVQAVGAEFRRDQPSVGS